MCRELISSIPPPTQCFEQFMCLGCDLFDTDGNDNWKFVGVFWEFERCRLAGVWDSIGILFLRILVHHIF